MEKLDKKTIFTTVVILIGVILSVYLALNYQNILSHAGSNDYNYFNVSQVKNGQETSISCDTNGSCQTQSLDVKLKINNLDQLGQ